MGWCTIDQVRDRNGLFTSEAGWSDAKIQSLIERITRRMKTELQQTFGGSFASWDANDAALLPPTLNDLAVELASVQGTLDVYRREGQTPPTQEWIAYNDIKAQLKQIVDNRELADPTGATIEGDTSVCLASEVIEAEIDVDALLESE